ncbi:MAG: replication factor C large subunit [Methanosarcinales archaeon]
MTIEWAEKYRPKSLKEIVGNNAAIKELHEWAVQWESGNPKERAVILYGRAGIGKTSAAHALANDRNWSAIELNASDKRTADIIQKIAGSASQMHSFNDRKRLIILDEADNIHGTYDKGGMQAIKEVIKNTRHPIILIANEYRNYKNRSRDLFLVFKRQHKPISFRAVSTSIIRVLKRICEKEGIDYEMDALEKIEKNANGDLRSAINDLQAIGQGRTYISVEDVITASRDSKVQVFNALKKVFKGTDIKDALYATYDLDETPEDFILWIDANLPKQYSIEDTSTGYNYLSKADIFLGRVHKQPQPNYRMWRYASALMTCGTVVAKSQKYSDFVKYVSPWQIKSEKEKFEKKIRNSIAKKIGKHCIVSLEYARTLIPFFKILIKNKKYSVNISAEINLDLDEIAFLMESKSSSKKVQKLYNSAQELIEKEKEKEEKKIQKSSEVKLRVGLSEEMVEERPKGATSKPSKPVKSDKEKIANEMSVDLACEVGERKRPVENKAEKVEQKTQKSLFDF